MAYKHFDSGLNGNTGKRIDKRFEEGQNEFLRQAFLGVERNPFHEDLYADIVVPTVDFVTAHSEIQQILTTDEEEAFATTIRNIPTSLDVILDLSHLQKLHTDGMIIPLVPLVKELMAHRRTLHLVFTHTQPVDVWTTMQMHHVAPIFDSAEAAFRRIQSQAA